MKLKYKKGGEYSQLINILLWIIFTALLMAAVYAIYRLTGQNG